MFYEASIPASRAAPIVWDGLRTLPAVERISAVFGDMGQIPPTHVNTNNKTHKQEKKELFPMMGSTLPQYKDKNPIIELNLWVLWSPGMGSHTS